MSKAFGSKGVRALRFAGVSNTRLTAVACLLKETGVGILAARISLIGAFLLTLGSQSPTPEMVSSAERAKIALERQQLTIAQLDRAESDLLRDVCELRNPQAVSARARALQLTFDGFTWLEGDANSLISALRAYRLLELEKVRNLADRTGKAYMELACVNQRALRAQVAEIRASPELVMLNESERKRLERALQSMLTEAGDDCAPTESNDDDVTVSGQLPDESGDRSGDTVGYICDQP